MPSLTVSCAEAERRMHVVSDSLFSALSDEYAAAITLVGRLQQHSRSARIGLMRPICRIPLFASSSDRQGCYWLTPDSTVGTVGWTQSPNSRGTVDILWSCAQTIFLCAWTMVCVNVPAPNGSKFGIARNRLYFVLLTLLGPELVFLLAFSQLQSARASVKQFRKAGYRDWTVAHGFYADMGGIHVCDPTWKSFPVNAKQLFYLLEHKYLEYPKITRDDIRLKGKTDTLGRIVTVGQSLYFVITTLARVQQGLAITTLELTVLGFVFCACATYLCWWSKPNDVEVIDRLNLTTSIYEILERAGPEADGIYLDTPLDFVDNESWAGINLWAYYVNILRAMGLFSSTSTERPVQRFSSFHLRKPQLPWHSLAMLWLGLAYAAIFFAAWNFYFPTRIERLLWRIFCTIQISACVLVCVFEGWNFRSFSRPDRTPGMSGKYAALGSEEKSDGRYGRWRSSFHSIWDRPCNNSIGRHRRLDIPLRSLLITTPLAAVYCVCRWYLLLEDILNLRLAPASVYGLVDWTQYLPSW